MGTHRDPSFSSSATHADATFYRDHGYWPVPQLVQWMVTERCSLDCGHCLAKGSEPAAELTLTEAADLLDQIAALGVPELLLTGGEPLERPDFPAIVGLLAERHLRWSLNTAVHPDEASLAAMRQWPPSFVAVSLDGPEPLHDRFRGRAGAFGQALAAIRCYAELTGGAVTVGTTVTRESFGRLDETFRAVVESGATGWGIHLVFPEGRAAERPDLQLTSKQARDLIEFVASRRQHFPVTLADEIGYCGEWEPLVRDAPFYCGAGRAQCVVLADGQVVPCSTTDRTVSAGTIRQRPLAALWRDGFGELRDVHLDERCGRCDYLSVCGGGCWLQRRHGLECLRPVWHRRSALSNAAGVAVCLGLAACGGGEPAPAQAPGQGTSPEATTTAAPTTPPVASATAPTTSASAPLPEPGFDVDLARCMVATLGPGGADGMALARLESRLAEDPARDEILALVRQERPSDLAQRVKQVTAAQNTPQRSLTLASLLWRDVASWALDCTRPEDRTDEERRLLRDTLTQLQATVARWRLEIVRRKLDPFFLRSDATAPTFMATKAMRKRAVIGPHSTLAFKHWGMLPNPATTRQLTKQFLDRHPFALNFRLALSPSKGSPLTRRSGDQSALCSAQCTMDVFDVFATPKGTGTMGATVTFGTHQLELDRHAGHPTVKVATVPGRELSVALPLDVELTHADVLRLTYEQSSRALGSAYGTPFELPALRKRLLERLAQEPQNPSSVDASRWDLLRAWLF